MIKKYRQLIIVAILGACSLSQFLPNKMFYNVHSISENEYNYVNHIGNEIIRCLKEKDKKGLNSLFCSKVRDTEYLNSQISFIFNYFDEYHDIVIEDGEWQLPYSHGSNDYSGKIIEYVSCKYDGKIFIDKKRYELRFTAYLVFKYHNDYEGVVNIGFLEYMTDEILDKSLECENNIQNEKKVFLGLNFYYINYNTYQYVSILPKGLNEKKEYEIPDNIENDS